MAKGKGWKFRASLLAVVALGCGANNDTRYAEAATGLGLMVGGTAMYRAQTGGCWANCTPGYACDRPSGLCHRTECVPACAPSQTCFIEADDTFRCVDVVGARGFSVQAPSAAASSAPTSSSAPVSGSAPPASSASPN